MIVSKELARAIATGKAKRIYLPATKARRRAKCGPLLGDQAYAPIPFSLVADEPILAPTDSRDEDEYGRAPAAHVTKAHVRPTRIQRESIDIDYATARKMGYATTQDAKAAFVRQHDRAWVERHMWDLLGDIYGTDVVPWILARRFDLRWHGREAWAIDFTLVGGSPRFLARADPSKGQGDYTAARGRAIDDLPVVDDAWLAVKAKRAGERDAKMRREQASAREAERLGRRPDRRPWTRAA